jgi:hypothetical protein
VSEHCDTELALDFWGRVSRTSSKNAPRFTAWDVDFVVRTGRLRPLTHVVAIVRFRPLVWFAQVAGASFTCSALIVLASACSDKSGAGTSPDTAMAGASGVGSAGLAGNGGAGGLLSGSTSTAGVSSTAPTGVAGAAGSRPAAGGGAGASAGSNAAVSGTGGAAAGGGGGAAGRGGAAGASGSAAGAGAPNGSSAGRGGAGPSAGRGGASAAGMGGSAAPGLTPVYRVPLRVHVGMSKLTDAELGPIFAELNSIWLEQAGVCFEIEVTSAETNRTDGFDFRYTSGQIPGASTANGLTQSAHSIWSIDHPRLNDVAMPVMNPTARTTAHELGHALGLEHENPPPSTDCASPCYCVQLGDDCDEYLLRSGTKGFHISKPEVDIARGRAARVALKDQASQCGAPVIMR